MPGTSGGGIPGLEAAKLDEYTAPRSRVLISGHGETGTGKSSFGFWAPDPILHVNLDRRVERVVEGFLDGTVTGTPKIIKPLTLRLLEPEPRFFTKSQEMRVADEKERKKAEDLWNRFVSTYKQALKSSMQKGGIRSIIIDTFTELTDLRLTAEFGRLMGFRQRERGGANGDLVELVRLAEDHNANLILLHQVKDEYARTKKQQKDTQTNQMVTVEESERTGKRIIKGYDKTPYLTQAHLVFSYSDAKKRFEILMERCKTNAEENGKLYTNDDWALKGEDGEYVVNYGPFAYVASKMTGTEIDEWI